ncbi:hypothetical protein [Afipia sp. GAS231]|uniref:hypothetical protein n=1 Tax=Afipia sp. GAS231 TaxID=1882747 RepID=UPI0012FB9125|nr:hypothetical protein [Afipia sp. GAS231]
MAAAISINPGYGPLAIPSIAIALSQSRSWIWTMVIVIGRSPNGRSVLGNHFGVVQRWLLAGDPMPAFLSGPGPHPTPTPAC